jgi:Glycosyl transferases group 1
MGRVTVAYNGVHQAYQIARAASEAQELDHFYCALVDAPEKWGRWVRRAGGVNLMADRHIVDSAADRIKENPWPLLRSKIAERLFSKSNSWFSGNEAFDRWVSSQLALDRGSIFVGTETCALKSFEAARRQGARLILDCPGFEVQLREQLTEKAAREFGLRHSHLTDTPEILQKKEKERELADCVIVYSAAHRKSLVQIGLAESKIAQIPLWADSQRWRPINRSNRVDESKLQVLYAGGITISKGIPYLLDAARNCGDQVHLTLAGTVADEIRPLLKENESACKLLPHQSKSALQSLYWSSDVLVLPSLGESWGFVAMEAMLSGLPVIITENCGVPVPDASWQVPIMNSAAIAERLMEYADNIDALRTDGETAISFASQFTAERYRDGVGKLFKMVRGN